MQRANLLWVVDEKRVGLVKLGMVLAVLAWELDGVEIDGFDPEAEDI